MKQTNKQKTKHNETQYSFNNLFASSLNTTRTFFIFKSIQMAKKKTNQLIVFIMIYICSENKSIYQIPKPVKWNRAIKHWIFV